MTYKTRFAIAVALLTLLTGSIVGSAISMIVLKPKDPVKFLRYELLSDEIAPGEPLRLKIESVRSRICPVKITRFIIDTETNSPVWTQNDDGGYTDIGKSEIFPPIHFGTMPVGEYIYTAVSEHFCDNGKFTVPHPRLPFKIVPR